MTEDKRPLSDRIHEILKENRRALYIGRLSDIHKKKFQDLAYNHFDDDYGMTLQHLIDTYDMADKKFDHLQNMIDSIIEWNKEIEAKIDNLSQKPKQGIKTVNGTILNRKGVERNEPGST